MKINKVFAGALALLSCCAAFSQSTTPIKNGKLQTPLDANHQSITNASAINNVQSNELSTLSGVDVTKSVQQQLNTLGGAQAGQQGQLSQAITNAVPGANVSIVRSGGSITISVSGSSSNVTTIRAGANITVTTNAPNDFTLSAPASILAENGLGTNTTLGGAVVVVGSLNAMSNSTLAGVSIQGDANFNHRNALAINIAEIEELHTKPPFNLWDSSLTTLYWGLDTNGVYSVAFLGSGTNQFMNSSDWLMETNAPAANTNNPASYLSITNNGVGYKIKLYQ